MTRLLFQCPKCPSALRFGVTTKNLGKTYTLTHPNCDGELQVVIPLNIFELAKEIYEDPSLFEDAMKGFNDLMGKRKKNT